MNVCQESPRQTVPKKGTGAVMCNQQISGESGEINTALILGCTAASCSMSCSSVMGGMRMSVTKCHWTLEEPSPPQEHGLHTALHEQETRAFPEFPDHLPHAFSSTTSRMRIGVSGFRLTFFVSEHAKGPPHPLSDTVIVA